MCQTCLSSTRCCQEKISGKHLLIFVLGQWGFSIHDKVIMDVHSLFATQIEGLQRHPRYGARVERRAYSSMFDAIQRILRLEGWAGLYKGIIPSTVKAAPAGAVTFVAYELTSDWLESLVT